MSSIRLVHQASAPPTPPSSRTTLYFDSDGILQGLDSAGVPGNVGSPAGTVTQFAGASAPTGWLICDGSSQLVTAYPVLQGVIGYTYGGSGANFNLPDLRGRTTIGVGTGGGLTARALADSSGQENITDVPAHTHPLINNVIDGEALVASPVGNYLAELNNQFLSGTANARTGDTVTASTGSASVDVMNPFLALNFIIKT